ncbi:MAG: iron-sulfur cluster assembly scaffold protein, partial [Pyrinomonadaceae bacterium]|nr:iron-sulfur cluster assembly scaffold protein [Pyrinomonadaceae bacterium]
MSFIEIGLFPIETGAALGRHDDTSKREKVKSKKSKKTKIFIRDYFTRILTPVAQRREAAKIFKETQINYFFSASLRLCAAGVKNYPVNFYPKKINGRFYNPRNVGKSEKTNAVGTGASFICGSFIRFYLHIDLKTKQIIEAKYKTDGCGFLVAAAEVLAEKIVGEKLTELHGLGRNALHNAIETELEKFPFERNHCPEICLDALQKAFSDFRTFQIEEFTGEKALICTCFSVSEETIEKVIEKNRSATVEEVTALCNAGGGCGSCGFLIQEMIDVY